MGRFARSLRRRQEADERREQRKAARQLQQQQRFQDLVETHVKVKEGSEIKPLNYDIETSSVGELLTPAPSGDVSKDSTDQEG